jgi:hypothetical protein
MPDRIPEPVFMPALEDAPAGAGVVESVCVEEGKSVDGDSLLFRVRVGDIEASVTAPFAGTVRTLHAAPGEPVREGSVLATISPSEIERPPPPALRRRLAAAATRLMPVGVAAGALVLPLVWLAASLVAWAAAMLLRWRRSPGFRPVTLISTPVVGILGAGACVIAGVVFAGAVGGALWLRSEGTVGWYAAARLAAFDRALGVAAFLACVWLLVSMKRRRGVDERLRGLLERAAAGVAGVVVVGLVALIVLAVTLPTRGNFVGVTRDAFRLVSPDAGAGWLAERRLDWATAEARHVVSCLDDHDRKTWRSVAGRRIGEDGLEITVFAGRRPRRVGRRQVSTLTVALANQLAPLGSTVRIRAMTRRHSTLAEFNATSRATPTDSVAGFEPLVADNRRVALTCSAASW